jgi:hypothetical protein
LLRQLARLTRPLPAAGPRALAIAVYADARGHIQPAAEAGFEGVACVDDAARGCELLCDLFAATGDLRLREWAEGLLEFLLWMHDGSGRWVNFACDWTGCRNVGGRTSEAGVNFWQGRALNAMVKAWLILGDQRARDALNLGMQAAGQPGVPSNVRALHVSALLHLFVAEPSVALRSQLSAWSDEILESRSGDLLMNSPDERGAPHLWGHIQEGVLADAGALLDREDLVAVAERSADHIFVELIESGFCAGRVRPYDVQSAVFVMDRLAAVTGRTEYGRLGRQARMWFDGRNPSGRPVYDRFLGRVADGIDDLRVNPNSGAESNIVAGLALADDAVLLVRKQPKTGPLFGAA